MSDVRTLPLPLDQLEPEQVYERLRATTGPGLLSSRASLTPDVTAYAEKHLGIYREVSWRALWERARRVGCGLLGLGVEAGDRVAIMGDAFPEWLAIDLGAQGIGAITYGIYPTSAPDEVRYLLEAGGATVFVAENQEYVDRVLHLVPELPDLVRVVAVDTAALFLYQDESLLSLAELEESGASHEDDGEFRRRVEALDPAAPAVIVWTSGTTARPKGALLAHGAHLASAAAIAVHYPRLAQPQRAVAFLPFCHVFGRDVGITLPLFTGVVPYYGESVEDLPTTLHDVAPTVLFTVPRYMQKFASSALVSIEQTSRTKRVAYRAAMRSARRANGRGRDRVGRVDRILAAIARHLVLRPMLDKFGLSHVRLAISAGAPLSPETAMLWRIWGISLCDLYGQTEAGGGQIAAQAEPFPEPGDVGVPPPGWDVRLAEDGEVVVCSPDLFLGYWNDREATAEVLVDGWLHTGDIGTWVDGGRLRLVDRKKDIITTSGGKTISPTTIENAVRASPYVNEVMAMGHERKYVTALVEIDYEAVAEWAGNNGVAYRSIGSLPLQPRVVELLEEEVQAANESLARVEQVKKIRLLPNELDPEHGDDPVTPTRKLKREAMQRRYAELVEEMYDDRESAQISAALHE